MASFLRSPIRAPPGRHTLQRKTRNTMAKLLICDDSLFQRRKLKHLFEEQGHEVTVAEDGEDALRKVESATPDLLLCDLLMPTLDGFGVLERLQT